MDRSFKKSAFRSPFPCLSLSILSIPCLFCQFPVYSVNSLSILSMPCLFCQCPVYSVNALSIPCLIPALAQIGPPENKSVSTCGSKYTAVQKAFRPGLIFRRDYYCSASRKSAKTGQLSNSVSRARSVGTCSPRRHFVAADLTRDV
jgi:hypothetical protein